MYKCKQCDKEYLTKHGLGGHISASIKNGTHLKVEKLIKEIINYDQFKTAENEYKCCDKIFTLPGIRTHYWRIHGGGINHKCGGGGKVIWNKGLTKYTSEAVNRAAHTIKNKYVNTGLINPAKGRKLSSVHIAKLKQNAGGVRKGAGRGKHGWYKEYWCDSTWELAWVIHNLDNNIKFVRNKEGFEYEFNNKIHKYYPDFILEDNTYIEIKGVMDDKNIAKINGFKKRLIILTKIEIEPIIKDIKLKYNTNDLSTLYDNTKYISKHKVYAEYIKNLAVTVNKRINDRKELIRKSEVNFQKHGWGQQLSKVLNITSCKAIKFVRENMIDELNPYFSHGK